MGNRNDLNIIKLYFGIYLMFGNCILDIQYYTSTKITVEPYILGLVPLRS